ncbi:class I adenylate-forming enzyme family protein [Streptomyces sp. NPDC021020]|uniref:class I adenylate-forming enzyme family protein n=1 Tax=Streptomyces sp. NPDC021020 TaxID=3365109 RepID=UPI00378AB805
MTVRDEPGREVVLLGDLLDWAAERSADRTAVVHGPRRCTVAELRTASVVAAATLHGLGVRRGDRVVIVVEDFLDTIAFMFGAARIGAVYVLVDQATPAYAAQHLLDDSEPRCVVAGEASHPRRCAQESGIPLHAPDCFGRPDPGAPAAPRPVSYDGVSILYTSGSTGRPKGVVATHANMVFTAIAIARRLRLREDDVIGCVLPITFDYGAYQILLGLLSGATLVWGRGAAAGPGLLSFLRDNAVTVLPAVPGVSHVLDRLSRRSTEPLPGLRVLTNTGAAMSDELRGRLRAAYPDLQVYLMFGLTECKRISILLPEEIDARPGSVGRALDDTECIVVDADGRALEPGQVGELVVRGPHVTQGYWRAPELTAPRFRPRGPMGERVLHTGDRCRLDDAGYLYFAGRDDDIYKSNGYRTSAVEVALAAEAVPGVSQAHCVPERAGSPAVLAVVTDLSAAEVRTRLHDYLEWFKVPDLIVVTRSIPLNRNGKADAEAVRALTSERGPV